MAHAVITGVELVLVRHVDQAAIRIRRGLDILLAVAQEIERQSAHHLREHGAAARGLYHLLLSAGTGYERDNAQDKDRTPHERLPNRVYRTRHGALGSGHTKCVDY